MLLRFQLAVVYLYASLWKMHPDWFDGHMCRGIFLTLEEAEMAPLLDKAHPSASRKGTPLIEGSLPSLFLQAGDARDVPWASIAERFPPIFQMLAVCGLLLDFLMLFSIALIKPGRSSFLISMAIHLSFHGFNLYALSPRIGKVPPQGSNLIEESLLAW